MPQHQQRRRNARENASPAVPGYMRSTLNSSARVRATFEHFNIQGQASGEAARPARRVRPNRRSRRYRRKAVIVEDDNIEVQDEAKEAEEVANPPLPMVAPQHGEGEVKEGDEAMSSGQAANEDVIEAAKEHVEEVADLLVRTPTPNAGEHEEKQPVVVEDDNIEVQDEAEKEQAEEVANSPLPMVAPQLEEGEVKEGDEAMSDGQAANEDVIEAAKEHVEEVADLLVRMSTPNTGEHEEKQPVIVEDDNIEVQDEISAIDETTADESEVYKVAVSEEPNLSTSSTGAAESFSDSSHTRLVSANSSGRKENFADAQNASTPRRGSSLSRFEVESMSAPTPRTTGISQPLALQDSGSTSKLPLDCSAKAQDSAVVPLQDIETFSNGLTPGQIIYIPIMQTPKQQDAVPLDTTQAKQLTRRMHTYCHGEKPKAGRAYCFESSYGLLSKRPISPRAPVMHRIGNEESLPSEPMNMDEQASHSPCASARTPPTPSGSSYGYHRSVEVDELYLNNAHKNQQTSRSFFAGGRTPQIPCGAPPGTPPLPRRAPPTPPRTPPRTPPGFGAANRGYQNEPCRVPPPPGFEAASRGYDETPCRTPPTPFDFEAASRGYDETPCRTPPTPFDFEAPSRVCEEASCRTPSTPSDFTDQLPAGEDVDELHMSKEDLDELCFSQEDLDKLGISEEDLDDLCFPQDDMENLHIPKDNLGEMCFSQEDLDELGISEEDLDDLCFPREDMNDLDMPKDNLGGMCFSQKNLDMLGISEEDLDDLCFQQEDLGDLSVSQDDLDDLHAVAESTAKEGPVESRLKLSDLATSGSSDVTSICTSEATAYSIDLQAAHAILDLFPYEEEEEEEEIDLGMSEAQSNVDFQRDSVRILAGSGASAKGAPSRVLSPASSLRQARALGDFEYEPPQPMPFTAHQRSERTVPIPEQRSASERLFSKATLGMRLSPHQPQASKTDRAEEDHRSFLTPMRPIHSSPKVSPLLSCEDNSPMPQPSCLRAQTMEEPRSAARVTADEAKLTAIEPEECEWIQLSVPNLPIKAIRSVSRAERSPLPLDELLEEINESFRKMDLRDAAKRDAREEGRSEPLFFASRDRSNQDHKVKT